MLGFQARATVNPYPIVQTRLTVICIAPVTPLSLGTPFIIQLRGVLGVDRRDAITNVLRPRVDTKILFKLRGDTPEPSGARYHTPTSKVSHPRGAGERALVKLCNLITQFRRIVAEVGGIVATHILQCGREVARSP